MSSAIQQHCLQRGVTFGAEQTFCELEKVFSTPPCSPHNILGGWRVQVDTLPAKLFCATAFQTQCWARRPRCIDLSLPPLYGRHPAKQCNWYWQKGWKYLCRYRSSTIYCNYLFQFWRLYCKSSSDYLKNKVKRFKLVLCKNCSLV